MKYRQAEKLYFHFNRFIKIWGHVEMGKRGGFTLIELLVVIVIILVLSTVAWNTYFKVQERARAVEVLNLLKSVSVAQRLYYQTNDQWATEFAQLDMEVPFTGTVKTFNGDYHPNLTDTRSNRYWSLQLEGGNVLATRIGGDYAGGGFWMQLGNQPQIFCIEKVFSAAYNNKYCSKILHGTDIRQKSDYMRYILP